MLASQNGMKKPEGSNNTKLVYDALENLVYGRIRNKLKLRKVTDGDTWAFVYRKGQLLLVHV